MGMQFTLGALVDLVGGVFAPLEASHISLQLIAIDFQFSKFLLLTTFHVCDAGLKLTESIVVCHGHQGGLEFFGNGYRRRLKHVLTTLFLFFLTNHNFFFW